ncbi:MAG: 4a-hydroxytetrahydrobiopterin dehydratase [Cyanobacteria bacterium SZAS-4]|nr:4a-hydroxytetrahydrobiopterin dehydratase [Cyanobacteria bacterium SZAS-4]
MSLSEKTCLPCKGDVPALTPEQIEPLLAQLDQWQCEAHQKIVKSFRFDNFKQAMDLATKVAAVAQKENHHPDLIVRWGELRVEIWTHVSHGLTENDFILASKIDKCATAAR